VAVASALGNGYPLRGDFDGGGVLHTRGGINPSMRSIVRKRLVALLSLGGLVGTTASAIAQADKSSTAADTKQESQVKLDKANQKNSTTKGGKKITPEYTRHKKGRPRPRRKACIKMPMSREVSRWTADQKTRRRPPRLRRKSPQQKMTATERSTRLLFTRTL
jgi:hypothetical protein